MGLRHGRMREVSDLMAFHSVGFSLSSWVVLSKVDDDVGYDNFARGNGDHKTWN